MPDFCCICKLCRNFLIRVLYCFVCTSWQQILHYRNMISFTCPMQSCPEIKCILWNVLFKISNQTKTCKRSRKCIVKIMWLSDINVTKWKNTRPISYYLFKWLNLLARLMLSTSWTYHIYIINISLSGFVYILLYSEVLAMK